MRRNRQWAMVFEHGPVLLSFVEVHEVLLCDVLGSESEPSGHAKQRMRAAGDDSQAIDAQRSERVKVRRARVGAGEMYEYEDFSFSFSFTSTSSPFSLSSARNVLVYID